MSRLTSRLERIERAFPSRAGLVYLVQGAEGADSETFLRLLGHPPGPADTVLQVMTHPAGHELELSAILRGWGGPNQGMVPFVEGDGSIADQYAGAARRVKRLPYSDVAAAS